MADGPGAGTNGDAPSSDTIEVVVPLAARHASLLRVVAATIGADVGFSIDEIDDVRLGLSEAFALLVERPPCLRVRAVFGVAGRTLSIRLVPESGPIDVVVDELAAGILRSVVDGFSIDADAITLSKRATETVDG